MNFDVCRKCRNGNPAMIAGFTDGKIPTIMGIDGNCCYCRWKKHASLDIFKDKIYGKFLFFNSKKDVKLLKEVFYYLEPVNNGKDCPFYCEHQVCEFNNPNKLQDIFDEAFKVDGDEVLEVHANNIDEHYMSDNPKLKKYYLNDDSIYCAYMLGLYESGIYPISDKFRSFIQIYKSAITYFGKKRGCQIIYEGWGDGFGHYDYIFKNVNGYLNFNSPLVGHDDLMRVMATFPLLAMFAAFDPFTALAVDPLNKDKKVKK